MPGRERGQGPGLVAVVLNEDEVPELGVVPVLAVDALGALRFGVIAPVVVDLGAGATGAGLPHLPEVLLLEPEDAALEEVRLLVPERLRLVVVRVDRGPEALLRELPDLREQLPGPPDGLPLEVVAEGPVPQHLEQGLVVGALAHVLQVVVLTGDADALLRVHGAGVVPPARAQEDVLELVHAGVGEQQRGVVEGDHRGAAHPPVAALFEEAEELFANLFGGHVQVSLGLVFSPPHRSVGPCRRVTLWTPKE